MRKFGPTTYAMETFAGLFSSTELVAPFVAFKKAFTNEDRRARRSAVRTGQDQTVQGRESDGTRGLRV